MTRPAIPPPPHAGRCLCGAVTYTLAARPLAINACHCDDCKKISGATHLLMVLVPREAFRHQGAVTRWRKRADSGRQIDIVRCAECGTRLWHEPLASPALLFLAAGTLDNPGWAVPTSHIWVEKAAPGTPFQPDAARIEGQPPTRDPLFEAFAKVYGA